MANVELVGWGSIITEISNKGEWREQPLSLYRVHILIQV